MSRLFRFMAIAALTSLMILSIAHTNTKRASNNLTSNKIETITLTADNSVVFRGVVTESKVSKVEQELLALSRRLPQTATIYLVMDSPGDDVDSGSKFIDFCKGLPQKVKTITVFAASMGFHIVQNLDERLVIPSGTLMSHRASVRGASGEIPGELMTRLMALLKSLTRMDQIVADRMGLTLDEYQTLIRDEYWTDGRSSLDERSADRNVYLACDKSLDGIVKESLGEFFGMEVIGTFSKCPAITGLLSYQFADDVGGDKEEASKAANLYMTDMREFVRRYILSTSIQ